MVVTTRRGARISAPREDDNDSSSDNASIPARTPPVQRRQPASRTPATLRPLREAAPSNANLSKRNRVPNGTPNAPQQKRRRVSSDAADTIEVALGEDDNVDAAINATSARSAHQLEIHLPSSRGLRESRGANSTEVSPRESRQDPAVSHILEERPESDSDRRPARHGNHVAGAAAEEVSTAAETPRSGGSPELQSSAVRVRSTRPVFDVYEVPEDDDAEPPNFVAVRGTRARNNVEISNGDKPNRSQARQPQSAQRNDQVSLIREEQSEPVARALRRPEPRQVTLPGNAPRLMDEGNCELGQYGNGRQVNQITEKEPERPREREETEETDETDETVDEDETDESESDEEAEQRKMGNIQVRPCTNNDDTVSVYSDHLRSISKLMGRRGWTGAGSRWMAELYANMPAFGVYPPIRTRLGKYIFKSLSCLKDELDEVPNALDLDEQYQYLVEHQLVLNAAISNVDKAVRKIERLSNTRLPKRIINDLSKCVIPMLVLVMQTSFAVGVRQPDAVVNDSLPKEGIFTWTTVQYLLGTLGWLSRLQKCLNPPSNGNSEHAGQQYDFEDPKHNHEKLAVMVRKFIQQIRHQVDNFNARADANRERYEEEQRIRRMKEEDRRIKEQNQREEEAELALARLEEEKFRLSLQKVTSQIRPLAERFRRATSHWQPAQVSQPHPQPSNPSTWTLSHLGPRSQSVGSSVPRLPPGGGQRAPQFQPTPPSPELGYPPWPEDETEWLLSELRRPERQRDCLEVWAETLERSPQEILGEKRRLERTGRYRSPTRQR
ncbi:hypothetical protein CHGG_08912 [Chaetomium globosum CBS 148.51]|uniref:Uncharacterized protein n=1 Tax=Chaetomium globosum (strain ATCC 6205 / CBS 148.51 / DSM 1962 / NBRC 6347 / NRRL 1970) TaxID=306901 RepID=Q2GSZ2_CHAGB|nr:uncharacterized protein CHGG_08912 [Chaetomium globosum CBS 148.51]EAQ84898.1 hypothetical protein CHGG_08912 [Chaetomium globosum CBS 148.51]